MLKRSLRLNTEEVFSSLSIRGSNAIEALLEHARAPAESKQLPSIGISNAAELIGYTSHYIRHLERCGDIPEPQKNEDGRRVYTLADINNIRDKLGKSLKRPTNYRRAISAFDAVNREILSNIQTMIKSIALRSSVVMFAGLLL